MATFTWIDKEPSTNFRNKVKGIDLTLEYSDGDKSTQTSCSTVFGADDIKPSSYWTDEKIDEFAEEKRAILNWDAQLKEDIK
mgnify:FL=1|jgi:thioredoxin reductase